MDEAESMNPNLKVELITRRKEKRGSDQASTECGVALTNRIHVGK